MTLMELMISMAIFSLIMVSVLSSVQSMMVARIKTMNRIALTEQLYLFSEKLFSEIKDGGTLDYEEYWNRKIYNTQTQSGHYMSPSWLGNYGGTGTTYGVFGEWLYYCRSKDGTTKMETGGCAHSANLTSNGQQQIGKNWRQRYGQYELQFWDYNYNHDDDLGDENGDGSIIGDEDDRNLLNGPTAFSGNTGETPELYLIDKNQNTRTFFRWNIIPDPNAPRGSLCSIDANGMPSDGCLGNIQVLKTRGYDLGLAHQGTGTGAFDGKIDTWVCDSSQGWTNCQWEPSSVGKVATGDNREWVNLFPNSVNVKNIRFEVAPLKDPWLAVAAPDPDPESGDRSPFIHPYVRVSLELGFSHGKRRWIKNEDPRISISTLVSLDDFH